MRRVASFLLLGVALVASADDIWRWKDANGVVHYSDSPVPGAERVIVGGSTTLQQAPAPAPAPESPAPQPAAPPPIRYTRCAIAQPPNDEVFFAVNTVDASLAIEPYLQDGHRIEVLLNGAPYPGWPAKALNHTFTEIYRGSYTLAVRILDAAGRTVCTGMVSNFHVRQPSILSPQSPQRQQAPAN